MLAPQADALAAPHEAMKAERTERFYDPARWSEQRRQQYRQAREAGEAAEELDERGAADNVEQPSGLWARLGRWWRGG